MLVDAAIKKVVPGGKWMILQEFLGVILAMFNIFLMVFTYDDFC